MTANRNLYETLGVDKGASKKDIRQAFRKLSRIHHPDKGGDAHKFKDVAAAYEILSDDRKRDQYDRYGSEWASSYSSYGGSAAAAATTADAAHTRYQERFRDADEIESSLLPAIARPSARRRVEDLIAQIRKEGEASRRFEESFAKHANNSFHGGGGGEDGDTTNGNGNSAETTNDAAGPRDAAMLTPDQ